MAEVDGKIVFKSPEGRMYRVPPEEAEKVTRDLGWTPASDEEAQRRQAEREQYAQYGSTGQQALGALEQTVRTASFGVLPGAPGWEDREEVLREESPVISLGAQVAGGLVPGLGAAGAVGRGLKAAGVAGRGITAGTVAAEGLTSGVADEVEQARYETRDVSVGNVFLYGLGSEVVGRALPAALKMGAGKIRRAVTPAEAAAGEGLENSLAAVEARSVKSQSQFARDLPDGPERQQTLQRPEVQAQLYDDMATESAKAMDENGALMSKLGDTSASPLVEKRLRETIPDKSPAQTDWVTSLTRRLDEFGSALHAPLRETTAGSVDELLASVKGAKAKAALAKEVNDEVAELARQKGLDPRDVIDRREIELEVLAARPIPSKRTLANSPGMSGIAQRAETTIRNAIRNLDASDDNVDWFLTARKAKQELQSLSAKMGKAQTVQDQELFDTLREQVDALHRHINQGTTDKALFGTAAEIERDINAAWHDKWFRGIRIAEDDLARKVDWDMRTGRIVNENDPAKLRSFLKGDAIQRQVTQKRLEMVIEGFEEMAAAHTRHGTALPAEIETMRKNATKIREALALADEIGVAKKAAPAKAPAKTLREQVVEKVKGYAADRGAGAVGAAVGGSVGGPVGMAVGWGAGEIARAGLRRAMRGVGKEAAEAAGESAAMRRARELLARRQGQTGAVFMGGEKPPGLSLVETRLRGREKLTERVAKKRADIEAADLEVSRHGRARFEAETPEARRAAAKLEAKARARMEKLEDDLDGLQNAPPDNADIEEALQSLAHDLDQAGDLAGLELKEAMAAAETVDDFERIARDLVGQTGKGGRGAERGFAETGRGLAGIATSPMGLVSGAGIAAAGVVAATRGEEGPGAEPGALLDVANRLVGIDGAARARSRLTARSLAGAGQASTAARSDPVTQLSRFSGDYGDPRASFDAKRQVLDQEQIDPTILYDVIAETLGDLPKVNPDLYQKVAARVASGLRYLRANMPAGIKTSLLYPNGTPPSESALRDWATMWNTFMDPESVYEDIDRGTATDLQMRTLQETHPDLYEDLRANVIEEVGVNFRDVPISTKLQLDMLFQEDGLAGPMFSSAAADMIGQAMKDQAAKGQGGSQPEAPSDVTATSAPGGINAIQSSVTNKGAGA